MLHVAVGVVRDAAGKVLIARRAAAAHQGGLWEFPGGKLERGETAYTALCRELHEEVGIRVQAARPLIRIRHSYPERAVLLDVWNVTAFAGQAAPREGQPLQWAPPDQLAAFAFPAGNNAIVKAVRLPAAYAILEGDTAAAVLANCRRLLETGISLLQIRLKALAVAELPQVLPAVLAACRQQQVTVLLNSDLPYRLPADGLHLSSRALLATAGRPPDCGWLGASCHNLAELQQAERIGADFAVLAPVLATASHPDAVPLGWAAAGALLEQVNLPVYLLGGMRPADCQAAFQAGAQGIAGISGFLETAV